MTIADEVKSNILADYNNKNLTMRELAQKYHISKGELAHIAVEMGAEPRSAAKFGRENPRIKNRKSTICPKCKKSINITGAKFCCFCGENIQSESEKLCERLERLITYSMQMPESLRDEMRDTLLTAIKEIRG